MSEPPDPDTRLLASTLARVHSFAFVGIEAVPVEVQVQISSGLPAFLVVGLADKAVAEARDPASERLNAAADADKLVITPEARRFVEAAAERLGFSARGYTCALRVARTIADLAASDAIDTPHVAEAFRFRHRIPGRPMPGTGPS